MRTRFLLACAAALLGAGLAVAGPLDDFQAALRSERDAKRRGTPKYVTLTRASRVRPKTALLTDVVTAAFRAARITETRFRRDADVKTAQRDLVAGLTTLLTADRDLLFARKGTFGADADAEQRLAYGIDAADAAFADAAGQADPFPALRHLRTASQHLREALPPQPDFSVRDVNANSATHDTKVSPRDFAERFSAYYFGHAT